MERLIFIVLLIMVGVGFYTGLYTLVKLFQRELAKLHALILKGERYHHALVKQTESVRR